MKLWYSASWRFWHKNGAKNKLEGGEWGESVHFYSTFRFNCLCFQYWKIYFCLELQIIWGLLQQNLSPPLILLSLASLSRHGLWDIYPSSVKYSFVHSGGNEKKIHSIFTNYHKAFFVSQPYCIQQLLFYTRREAREKLEFIANKKGIGGILTWQVRFNILFAFSYF